MDPGGGEGSWGLGPPPPLFHPCVLTRFIIFIFIIHKVYICNIWEVNSRIKGVEWGPGGHDPLSPCKINYVCIYNALGVVLKHMGI